MSLKGENGASKCSILLISSSPAVFFLSQMVTHILFVCFKVVFPPLSLFGLACGTFSTVYPGGGTNRGLATSCQVCPCIPHNMLERMSPFALEVLIHFALSPPPNHAVRNRIQCTKAHTRTQCMRVRLLRQTLVRVAQRSIFIYTNCRLPFSLLSSFNVLMPLFLNLIQLYN